MTASVKRNVKCDSFVKQLKVGELLVNNREYDGYYFLRFMYKREPH